MHILVLTDRDWAHPQGGGTGTTLRALVLRWTQAGHRVTMIAGAFPGCETEERPWPGLEIHRCGTRLTVFPRAALKVLRGVGRDADVVLEMINGIAFFTPLWLRRPRAAIVQHVHQGHYVYELGLRGRIAAFLLERLPLRHLYRGTPIVTFSEAASADLVELGVHEEDIRVIYLGVDPQEPCGLPRAERPALLYVGRLKRYKRIELLLDVLEEAPGSVLDIAGEGDHRAALEAEVARRALGSRVCFHGHVDERTKTELYAKAWLLLTASSAEGWCHTVMEAATQGTPTAALRVGGLCESVVDGRTGLLADDVPELARHAREIIESPDLRDRLGENARERAREFTWERTASEHLEVLQRVARSPRPSLRARLRSSQSAIAGGLAAATLLNNAIQLVFTIVFARLLGQTGYGSLAALMSVFLVLLVGGQAVQVAAARDTALGRIAAPGATAARWTRTLMLCGLAAIGAGFLLRAPLASLVGVPDQPLAAAAIPVTGAIWLLISLQRGVLQGSRAYGTVGVSIIGEAAARLAIGLVLVGAGMGVAGAYLGTPLALLCVSLGLGVSLRRRRPREPRAHAQSLRALLRDAWVPVAALSLLALLQNVDLIVVRHQLSGSRAGSYAAAAVAAKAVVWVAIGIAVYLLPEATRRAAAGVDPRPVLLRALGVLALVAAPALLIFSVAPSLVLSLAFGGRFAQAAGALPLLAVAMTLLAVAYLSVQYMLALGNRSFLWVLALVAAVEPFLLSSGSYSLAAFAAVVLALQLVAGSLVLGLGLRVRPASA